MALGTELPPVPLRPPPGAAQPQLLLAPRPPAELVAPDLALCFSFGQGPDGMPGGTNRALAAFVARSISAPAAGGPRILAQWEIARELEGFGVAIAHSVEPTGGYITSQDVLNQFVAHSPPGLAGGGFVVVVAHPDHAWRCWALVVLAGYVNVVVPEIRTPSATNWEPYGCDAYGYDPTSVQPHTTSKLMFWPYEERMQQCILLQHPTLVQRYAAAEKAARAVP